MTAPLGRQDATVRGAVVLVVAIVIGLALLWRTGGDDEPAADTTTTQATVPEVTQPEENGSENTVPPLETSPTEPTGADDTRPPTEVSVLVLNGTPDFVAGVAGDFDGRASGAGYTTLSPTNAAEPTETTTIYAAEGFEVDAQAVQAALGLGDAPIEPLAGDLGPGSGEADIVVVLGADYPS